MIEVQGVVMELVIDRIESKLNRGVGKDVFNQVQTWVQDLVGAAVDDTVQIPTIFEISDLDLLALD